MKKPANEARLRRLLGLAMTGLCALMMLGAARPCEAVPIFVTYADEPDEGFNDPQLGTLRKTAFEAATDTWAKTLEGTVPVEISATFDALPFDDTGAVLGAAGANYQAKDFAGITPPRPNTFYAAALANQLAGTDLMPGSGVDNAEIRAFFSSDIDGPDALGTRSFYYGLDGNPPPGDIDFYSVCLHEFCHGLGFFDNLRNDGSFGAGLPNIWDTFLTNAPAAGSPRLIDLTQDQRNQALIGNSLYFDGPQANAAAGGSPPKIFAPDPFQQGSSTAHLDEDTYSGPDEFMTPFIDGVPNKIGPITIGIMRDLGWRFSAIDPTPTPTPTPGEGPTPTPTPNTGPTPTPGPSRLPPPPNDNFANAQELKLNGGVVLGRNINATKEQGEPNHVNTGGTSIWYRWKAPARGRVVFNTAGSTDQNGGPLDTLLAVYVGRSVDRLTRIAANDDVVTGTITSSVTFNAVAGTTYYIAVDGFFGAMGRTILRYQFVAAPPEPPRNDNFERAQPISGPEGRYASDSRSATIQRGEPAHAGLRGGRSVWFNWTAPASGTVVFTTAGSASDPAFESATAFDTTLAVYIGNTLTALTPVTSNNDASSSDRTSRVSFEATARRSYKIAVDGVNGLGGIVLLNWSMSRQAPANDLFANAEQISGLAGRVLGNNFNATKETGEPNHAGNSGGHSVWYRWVAPASGRTGFTTAGSGLLTALDVYTGSRLNTLRPVEGSVRNGSQRPTDTVIFEAVAGTTYYIAVDGFFNNRTGSTAVGPFRLNWVVRVASPTPAPVSGRKGGRSPVVLSSVMVSALLDTVALRFSGPLDEQGAAEAGHYSVEINGIAVEIEAVSVHANNEVSLALPTDALRAGDEVTVVWRGLLDVSGLAMDGQTSSAAR